MKYDDLTYVRNETVDGETNWHWIRADNGAWDGPKKDWETSHKFKYMKHLRGTDVVITAGANQGMYARLYSKLFKTVYAFEPDPLNFHCMVQNCQEDNIIKMQCGLGDSATQLLLNRPSPDNTGMNHFVDHLGVIPVMPLDAFNFPHVDLIQLDVEGFEPNVLIGAYNLIKKCHPVLVLERAHAPAIQHVVKTLNYKEVELSEMDSVFVSNEI